MVNHGISKHEAVALFGSAGYTTSMHDGIVFVQAKDASEIKKVRKFAKQINYVASLAVITKNKETEDSE